MTVELRGRRLLCPCEKIITPLKNNISLNVLCQTYQTSCFKAIPLVTLTSCWVAEDGICIPKHVPVISVLSVKHPWAVWRNSVSNIFIQLFYPTAQGLITLIMNVFFKILRRQHYILNIHALFISSLYSHYARHQPLLYCCRHMTTLLFY